MKEPSKDRRYRRTQKQLENALINLLNKKSINDISVRELSELADINRATFYLHYKTPNDILLHLENELFEAIFTSYQNHDLKNSDDFFLCLYQSIKNYSDFSQVLLIPNVGSTFWNRISKEIIKEYTNLWSDELPKLTRKEIDYFATFIVDGYLAVVKSWLANGMQETPEEMLALTKQFECKPK
jgi:AcrR family transcriptional regulator